MKAFLSYFRVLIFSRKRIGDTSFAEHTVYYFTLAENYKILIFLEFLWDSYIWNTLP